MNAPAGPCEWCGGPQWWTFDTQGVMFVKCKHGCLSLFYEDLDFPSPDSEGPEERVNPKKEPWAGGGVKSFVGSEPFEKGESDAEGN